MGAAPLGSTVEQPGSFRVTNLPAIGDVFATRFGTSEHPEGHAAILIGGGLAVWANRDGVIVETVGEMRRRIGHQQSSAFRTYRPRDEVP